jgi:hypothetical protein
MTAFGSLPGDRAPGSVAVTHQFLDFVLLMGRLMRSDE